MTILIVQSLLFQASTKSNYQQYECSFPTIVHYKTMDGVVSARAGSVVVCGGHGVMVTNNMTHDHTVSISWIIIG